MGFVMSCLYGGCWTLTRAPDARVFRLANEDGRGDRREEGQPAAEQEDRVKGPFPGPSPESVERPGQHRSRHQPTELRALHPAVSPAAVLLGAQVCDEGQGGRRDRGRADPLQKAKEDEPDGMGRGDEQQLRDAEEGNAREDHWLAADTVAEASEHRGARDTSYVVSGRDHPDEPHRGVRLLLEEDGKIGKDRAEPRPDDEASGADDAQLEPQGAFQAHSVGGRLARARRNVGVTCR